MSILRDSDRNFENRVPIVIIGAGACGLTAALAANDAGASVLVLERDARPWGSTGMSIGAVCAVGSAEQRRHGVADSVESFVADVMAKSNGRARRELAELIGRNSGSTVDWLAQQHAVPLKLDFAWRGLGHSKARLHVAPARTGEDLISRLLNAVDRAGVPLLTRAHVTALVADSRDRVRGVKIARSNGVVEWLGCDAVVLATCGFGGNRTMIRRHIPEIASARYFGHEGNQGEGIEWGAALGAKLADMSAYQGLGTLAEPQSIIVPHTLLIDGGILVNAIGHRFTHELDNISGMCVPVLAQPGGIAWVIFDGQLLETSLAHSHELRQLDALGAVKRAASLRELENSLGMQENSLLRELTHVDSVLSSGAADRFGRKFAGARRLISPYCAVRVTGALFHTQGGLMIDDDARVMRPDGSPLPNLFAGGGAAQSVSGPDVTGYLPAIGLCMAITLGRVAGQAAARLCAQ
jgi:fumarate reductase flavoprotein subunit